MPYFRNRQTGEIIEAILIKPETFGGAIPPLFLAESEAGTQFKIPVRNFCETWAYLHLHLHLTQKPTTVRRGENHG